MTSIAGFFDNFTSTWSLIVISAILGVILVWLYKYISFQKTILRVKRKISCEILEPLVFRDSPLSSISSFLKLFISAGHYLCLTLPPFLILGLPVVWIFGFMNQSYGYQKPTRPFTVTVELENPRTKTSLIDPTEKNEISPPVKSLSESTIAWRVTPLGGSLVLNGITIYPALTNGSVPILTNSAIEKLIYPGSGIKLPQGISRVQLDLPTREIDLKLFSLHWIFVFLLVSIFSGLIFAKFKRIEI